MQQICPITDKRIDEKVARINGIVTLLLVVLFIVFNFWVGLAFLVVDFAVRGFIDSKYSLVCKLSKYIAKALNFEPKAINAGPKIFAAQVGLVFTLVALVAFATGNLLFGLVTAGVLGFFSLLESAFGFCVACQLYPFFRKAN
jgi:hypothetical protein